VFTAVTSTVSFFAKHTGPVDDNASELTRGEETQLLTWLVRCNTRVVTAQSDITGHCIRIMHNCQPVTTILNSVISVYSNLQSGPQKTVPYIILFKKLLHLLIRTKSHTT